MATVELKQLIYCEKKRRGNGTSFNSPIRTVVEIFEPNGQLLAEADSSGIFTIEDMWDFCLWCKATDDYKDGNVNRWKKNPKP